MRRFSCFAVSDSGMVVIFPSFQEFRLFFFFGLTLMATMESKPIEIAALGRPLCPGMLYDCCSDSFIPGVTLWDKASLKEDLYESWQPKTDLKFSASDSLSEKANFMDVSASLKASFLGGLVEVGGSAKYLHDSKSSARQSRCTLMYSQTTKFEQLTMTLLGNITYPQVFEQKTATHVVTAVLYGAQAFMVFDHMASTVEDQQKVEGNIQAVIKKIPSFSIEGQADLKMNDDDKKLTDEINVTFYGDFHLEKNPMTYKEALTVYNTLPSLLKDKENYGVPIKVWLYPLVLLDQKAAVLVREISTSLVSKTEHIVEQLGDVERRCNDLVENRTVQDFPVLQTRLQTFQGCFNEYKVVFQKALCRVLPDIRGGGKEEQALAEILDIHNKTPFTANKLNVWLESITTELQILSSYTKGLKDIRALTSLGQLNAILFDPDVSVVVCLAFTSLTDKDKFLGTINKFLSSEDFKKLENVTVQTQVLSSQMPWFTSFDISRSMRENFSLFKSFSKANKNNERIQFVIASIPDPSNPGTSIYLYEKGRLTDFKFKPVSKPPPPILDKSEFLKLQKSPTGETVSYRVQYRRIDAADAGAKTDQEDKQWENRDTPDANETFNLRDLQLGNQYWVRYRAVSKVGVSEASESIRFIPKATEDPNPSIPDYLIDCTLIGGPGGSVYKLSTPYYNMALKKIKVSVGHGCVDAIHVRLSSHQKRTFGSQKQEKWKEFLFEDGDRFTSLTLWPTTWGNRLGGLEFQIMTENKQSKTFSAKCRNLGQAVSIDVHSGICYGVKGRSGFEVDAFGFIFSKK
ncbi:hypothetical protein MHYP_G00084930 [Metynnis hypsauchen]